MKGQIFPFAYKILIFNAILLPVLFWTLQGDNPGIGWAYILLFSFTGFWRAYPRMEDYPQANSLAPIEIKAKILKSSLDGTILVHGIFFAHEAERDNIYSGTIKSIYWPNSRENIINSGQWERY